MPPSELPVIRSGLCVIFCPIVVDIAAQSTVGRWGGSGHRGASTIPTFEGRPDHDHRTAEWHNAARRLAIIGRSTPRFGASQETCAALVIKARYPNPHVKRHERRHHRQQAGEYKCHRESFLYCGGRGLDSPRDSGAENSLAARWRSMSNHVYSHRSLSFFLFRDLLVIPADIGESSGIDSRAYSADAVFPSSISGGAVFNWRSKLIESQLRI